MDKQPKLIDAEKVFDWANDNISTVDFARLHQAFKNGEFDPIPPTIKQGDRVFNSYYDEGTVKVYDLYGDGRALVEFDDPKCGERLVERNKLEVIPNE